MTLQQGRSGRRAAEVHDRTDLDADDIRLPRSAEFLYSGERIVRSPWGLDDDDPAPARRTADPAYRAECSEQLRLSRLRLYSYCMTLGACVLALMAFMYLLTGTADGDAEFTSLGVMFVGMMILLLWAAMRVTRAGEA